jgi:sugar phosphate permease
MTISELLTLIAIVPGIIGMIVSVFLYFDKRKTTDQSGLVSRGDFVDKMTEAMDRVTARAEKAEKELQELKVKFDLILEKLQYIITFDVVLDPESPRVDKVTIKHRPKKEN